MARKYKYSKTTLEELKQSSLDKDTIHNAEDVLYLTLRRKSLTHLHEKLRILEIINNYSIPSINHRSYLTSVSLVISKRTTLRASPTALPIAKINSVKIQILKRSVKPNDMELIITAESNIGQLTVYSDANLKFEDAVSISDRIGKYLEKIYPVE